MEGRQETPNPNAVKYPLQPIVERWKRVFTAARKDKREKFDVYAEEAMNFFDGPVNHMWSSIRAESKGSGHDGFLAPDVSLPQFEMSVNRLFEAVALFGPVLYHQNPTIAVTPRKYLEVSMETFYADNDQAMQVLAMMPQIQSGMISDPGLVQMAMSMQQQYQMATSVDKTISVIDKDHALILEQISNYIQNEGSKQDEARMAITEAIITGLGLLETRMESPASGGPKMARSRYISNKDLLVDPDACYWRDVTWIALRSIQPANIVEKKFGLKPGSMKGKYAKKSTSESLPRGTKKNGDGTMAGASHDLVEYWEVYSKNGAGQNLKLTEKDAKVDGLDVLGDFVYLAICEQCPYPLNLSPEVMKTQELDEVLKRTEWEAPYWDDHWADGGWPICRLSFHEKPNEVWPISMVKPAIGELRFVNWCMSFIADKVASGSKIYVGVLKEAAENIRTQLTSGRGPFSIIDIERISGKSLADTISFMQAPNFSIDIWNMVAQVNEQIDKRLGLSELRYGNSSRQMRSAAEAQIKQENINIRPDDMASRVEDWLSLVATREIQLMTYRCEENDVIQIVGQTAARVFVTQILTDDVSRITRDFKYRVEAGSAKKPNKEGKISQLIEFGQYVLPVIQQAMMSGVTGPYNSYMKAIASAMDLDPTGLMMTEQDQQTLLSLTMMQNAPPPEKSEKESDEPQE